MTLPQADITRIESDAKNYGEKSHDLYSTTLNASQISYFAGAKAEAVRGSEQERTRFIEFLQWLSAEEAEYSILYGGEPERFCSTDHDYTSEQIADLFLDTQKKKG